MSKSNAINVYEISESCSITLINPDEGFSNDDEAEAYAFAVAGCDGNPANRYLVVEGTLFAAFPATGSLGVQEPGADEFSMEPDAA